MGTIAQKLTKLLETKSDIKAAITEKGQVPGDVFDEYGDKIRAIQTGIDTSDATATMGDIAVGKTAYVDGEKVTGNVPIVQENFTKRYISDNVIISQQGPTGGPYTKYLAIKSTISGSSTLFRPGSNIYVETLASNIGDATVSDVASGKTFTSENGVKITGTGTISQKWKITLNNTRYSDTISVYGDTINILQLNYGQYQVTPSSYFTFITNLDSNRTPNYNNFTLARTETAYNEGYKFWIFRVEADNAVMSWT